MTRSFLVARMFPETPLEWLHAVTCVLWTQLFQNFDEFSTAAPLQKLAWECDCSMVWLCHSWFNWWNANSCLFWLLAFEPFQSDCKRSSPPARGFIFPKLAYDEKTIMSTQQQSAYLRKWNNHWFLNQIILEQLKKTFGLLFCTTYGWLAIVSSAPEETESLLIFLKT